MRCKILVLSCLLIWISFISCNNNKTASNKEELDTVWNEKVQDSFYGLKLGSPASVEQIAQVLGEHGFYLKKEYSTDETLHFRALQSQYFTFGGLSWEMLDIFREGDILQTVCFRNSSLDKAESIQNYNNIKNAIENKYLPTLVQPKDTTLYAQTRYFGRNNVEASISCYRYETVGKEIMICTELGYWTRRHIKSSKDEL